MRSVLFHYGKLLGSSLILLLVVITLLFLLLQIAPGDPIQTLVGDVPVPADMRAELNATFGLDRPIYERYFIYLGSVLTGNLGVSFGTQTPVLTLILGRLGNTLALAVPAFILSTIGAVVFGAVAARTRKRWLDAVLSGGAVALFSVPTFWLGLMLMMFFSYQLGVLPIHGKSGYGVDGIEWQYLILPVVTMASAELAFRTRIMRSSVIDSLGQDFIDTARSKGLSSDQVLWRHALPNALLPMVTVSGYSLGFIFAGSVLIERVFGWPGMGLLFIDAIDHQDNLVVLGVVIFITVTILIVNILTDVVYGVVDPRLRARFARQVRSSS